MPPAAKGLATFGMALVLAAGSASADWKPAISLRAPAKPKITRDRTMVGAVPRSIACGASRKVDINWRIVPQPRAMTRFQSALALWPLEALALTRLP